jgi:Flp pilus assembly protein TadD/ADP-heptose:LPS heptosyltransferase
VSQPSSPALQALIRDALKLHQAGRLAEAEHLYRQALALDPLNADGLHLLGMAAFQSGREDEAEQLILRAIGILPTAASYHANLGNVLQAQGKLAQAEASYRRALELRPEQAEVHLNLGHVLKAQGQVDLALVFYQRTLALKPDLAEAAASESMALLLKGDFACGWKAFEFRWQIRDWETPMRTYPQPLWMGEQLPSARLLVWGEQGIGDEIMFAGLVPELLRAGHRCALDCDPRLQTLFARSFPGVEVVSGFDPQRDKQLNVAAHLPSGSLPGLFRTSLEAFRSTQSPYLAADPVRRDRIRRSRPGLLIGLAWHTRNRQSGSARSIDLALFAPLFASANAHWISLQYGDQAALEAEAVRAAVPLLIDRSVDQLSDIDIFAAQVAAMDLVITIDNSTAHLAAALGIPTWLLLPFAPDWRWLLERDTSPWYPPMRIFRQPRAGDWHSVLDQVQSALEGEFPR